MFSLITSANKPFYIKNTLLLSARPFQNFENLAKVTYDITLLFFLHNSANIALVGAGEGEVYTWGWSECVPNVKPNLDESEPQGDDASAGAPSTSLQLSPRNNVVPAKPSSSAPNLRTSGGALAKQSGGRQSHRNLTCKTSENKGVEEILKKRKVVSFEDGGSPESPTAAEENVFAPPCLVNLDPGIRISTVAAGGRHTLALSGELRFQFQVIDCLVLFQLFLVY